MTTSMVSAIQKRGLAAGFLISLILTSFAFAPSVDARMPAGERLTSEAIYCGKIQDRYDAAVEDYRNAQTQAEKDKARKRAYNEIDAWINSGCDHDYGSINRVEAPGGELNDITYDISGSEGVLDEDVSSFPSMTWHSGGSVYTSR